MHSRSNAPIVTLWAASGSEQIPYQEPVERNAVLRRINRSIVPSKAQQPSCQLNERQDWVSAIVQVSLAVNEGAGEAL